MTDWVITIPKTVSWEFYKQEICAAEQQSHALNFRVPYRAAVQPGDRVFVVWNGRVRGWMEALDTVNQREGFFCTTTKNWWKPGFYVRRSGKFHEVDGPEMKGFRGIRRFELV